VKLDDLLIISHIKFLFVFGHYLLDIANNKEICKNFKTGFTYRSNEIKSLDIEIRVNQRNGLSC
jgi:hypothetical protein